MSKHRLVDALLFAALASLPLWASGYVQDLATKVMILALFALSLQLLVGVTGLVSLGHAAFLGIGAYVTVLFSPANEAGNLLALMLASCVAAGAYALLVGVLSLRTQGVYFIMVTLAFAQMAYFVFHDTQLGGGSDGIYLNVRPALQMPGVMLDLENKLTLYGGVLIVLLTAYLGLGVLLRSRFGAALQGIRVNEQRMRAAGFNTFSYKLAAFVLAGALAGLAGFLLASKDAVVNPELLAWHESGAVLLMLILGGLHSLRGALVGATAFTLLKELLSSEALLGSVAAHWQLTLGLSVIACVVFMPRGIMGLSKT